MQSSKSCTISIHVSRYDAHVYQLNVFCSGFQVETLVVAFHAAYKLVNDIVHLLYQ